MVEVFNRNHRLNPDVGTYSVLIYGWCKIVRIEMSERFIREMGEGIGVNVVK